MIWSNHLNAPISKKHVAANLTVITPQTEGGPRLALSGKSRGVLSKCFFIQGRIAAENRLRTVAMAYVGDKRVIAHIWMPPVRGRLQVLEAFGRNAQSIGLADQDFGRAEDVAHCLKYPEFIC